MTIIYRKLYNKRNHTYENIVILTIKKANHTLGAQITWQVSGSNTVYYASRASGTGASVTSKSKNLKGKKGKSFGYYYVDGKLKHESTAWMNFKF